MGYDSPDHPVKTGGLDTNHAAAVVVLSALAFLVLIRRGFRGVGVSAGVSIG